MARIAGLRANSRSGLDAFGARATSCDRMVYASAVLDDRCFAGRNEISDPDEGRDRPWGGRGQDRVRSGGPMPRAPDRVVGFPPSPNELARDWNNLPAGRRPTGGLPERRCCGNTSTFPLRPPTRSGNVLALSPPRAPAPLPRAGAAESPAAPCGAWLEDGQPCQTASKSP